MSVTHELLYILENNSLSATEDATWCTPFFFRLTSKDDQLALETLLRQKPYIKRYDTIASQLNELIKARNPSRRLSAEDIAARVQEHLAQHNGVPLAAYGVWVYYPWLEKLVHILDEDEFAELRTNRNRHKITSAETAVLAGKKIGVIGLSVGQSIALTLAMERSFGELRIADFDALEITNLNRLRTGVCNLGVEKTVLVAREIAEIDPYLRVTRFAEGITEENLDTFLTGNGKLDLLIEECDSLDIKVISRARAKAYGIPVVMETNDRGMIDIERYDLDSNYPVFHGLAGELNPLGMKDLTNEQKLPIMMKLIGVNTISSRGKVTLIELGQTLSTWPQLASSVIMGGGMLADISRRILLNQLHVSGRFYVDIEELVKDKEPAPPVYTPVTIETLGLENMQAIADRVPREQGDWITPSVNSLQQMITDANTAPSSGNDQPWKWLLRKGRLLLFHEKARTYSFGDYRDMASYIALGAALENLVLSAHRQQLEPVIRLFPLDGNKQCVAVVYFQNYTGSAANKTYDDLYEVIHERCTNRKITPNKPLPLTVQETLKEITASVEGAAVDFITGREELEKIGRIISAVDRMRILNPHGHYDFFHREMRWTAEEAKAKRNGMDVNTLELSSQALMALKVVRDEKVVELLRQINGGTAFKGISVENTIHAAAMGLVTMPAYTPIDFINGGRAVQRQWLKTTALGYAYHPMIAPLYLFPRVLVGNGEGLDALAVEELKTLREEFMQLFPGDPGRGEVFLFRIFKADQVTYRSLRLPLEETLFIED